MTDEMIDLCYIAGKKLYSGENLAALADNITAETGMKQNSSASNLVGGVIMTTCKVINSFGKDCRDASVKMRFAI